MMLRAKIMETLLVLLEAHKTELKSWEDAIEALQTCFLPGLWGFTTR